jgi:hypothetical protein
MSRFVMLCVLEGTSVPDNAAATRLFQDLCQTAACALQQNDAEEHHAAPCNSPSEWQRAISHVRVCNFIQTGDAAICQAQGDSFVPAVAAMEITMSIGLILVIILVIFLLGGFSGRFGGYGYGYGHGGMGIIGTVLVVLLILFLLGRI